MRGSEDVVYSYFRSPGYNKLNFMDLMAGIISFSVASWQAKVKLSFLTFDFDESKNLTKDEMVIMILTFIRSIGTMTNSSISKSIDLEGLAKHCFELADTNPDSLVTLEELTNWVQKTPAAYNLFIRTEIKKRKPVQFPINIPKKVLPDIKKGARRESISFSFTGRKIIRVVQNKREKKKDHQVDEHEVRGLFNQVANQIGIATLGNVFMVLAESPKFSEDTDFLFHEFGFDRSKEIRFEQLFSFLQRRRSKSGYVFQRGNLRFTDLNSNKVGNYKRNSKVLNHMFQSFDKNKDGLLTLEELSNGLKQNFNPEALKSVFKTYDQDHNQVLDFHEFLNLFTNESDAGLPKK